MSRETKALKTQTSVDVEAVQKVLLGGDLSSLRPEQKIQYYNRVCELVGLNPLTKPFDYIKLSGKEVLYANKGCAEQLRMVHKISIKITNRETIEGVYVVTVEAFGADARVDSATGAVPISGLKGESLANAFLKCETKAKRRATLSICGLNMLDESEVDSIKENPMAAKNHQPEIGDGVQEDDGLYRFPRGQWKARTLEDVYKNFGPDAMAGRISFWENSSAKSGKPLSPEIEEAIRQIETFLGNMENGAAQ